MTMALLFNMGDMILSSFPFEWAQLLFIFAGHTTVAKAKRLKH